VLLFYVIGLTYRMLMPNKLVQLTQWKRWVLLSNLHRKISIDAHLSILFVSTLVISTTSKGQTLETTKGSNPMRTQIFRKKFKTWMIKKDFVSNIKLISCNYLVMKTLGLFFVNPCILIGIIMYLFQLLQLQLPYNPNNIITKLALLNGPKSFVFKLHW